MGKLLKKEMVLAALSISYVFIAFCVMTMVPGYPIAVGGFFVCLGIFFSFQAARENNDTLYTALLPVRKVDVVRAKYVFVIVIQMVNFVLSAILTLVRMTCLSGAKVYVENPMMNANLAFLGYLLIVFSLFNIIFLRGFFKTAYYVGKPFLCFSMVAFLVISVAEVLHHIPGLTLLNTTTLEGAGMQALVLGIGILWYVMGTVISLRVSEKRFETIDL